MTALLIFIIMILFVGWMNQPAHRSTEVRTGFWSTYDLPSDEPDRTFTSGMRSDAQLDKDNPYNYIE